jgi:hypothetical protein
MNRQVEIAMIITQQIFISTKMRIGWKIPVSKYPIFALPPNPDQRSLGGMQAQITVKPRVKHYLVVSLNAWDLYDVSIKTVNLQATQDPINTVVEEKDVYVDCLNESIMRCFNSACQAAGVHV